MKKMNKRENEREKRRKGIIRRFYNQIKKNVNFGNVRDKRKELVLKRKEKERKERKKRREKEKKKEKKRERREKDKNNKYIFYNN